MWAAQDENSSSNARKKSRIADESFLSQPTILGIQDDPLKTRAFLTFDVSYIKKKDKINSYLAKSFPTDFDRIKPNSLSVSNIGKKINLIGLGICEVYTIHFSAEVPEIVGTRAHLIYSDKIHKATILFLDTMISVKIKKRDTEFLIGGIYRNKGLGYFTLYKFMDGENEQSFSQIFNTSDSKWCRYGVPVYNSSLDCKCYDPFTLHLDNVDVNNDGLSDLIFSGSILTFCNGLEKGYGRKDRKPLQKEKIKIIFLTGEHGNDLYWKLANSEMCEKI